MSWNQRKFQLQADNIVYAFSDAAGANACLAMFEMNVLAHQQLFSNRHNYLEKYKQLVQNEMPDFSRLSAQCLFTGTSHPESSDAFEVRCISEAKKHNVYTIAFIDHWINFLLRFRGLSQAEFPDEIWVVDENAKALACAEGLPADKIKIIGNPYHYYLRNCWKPSYDAKTYLDRLEIPRASYHILFAPDPFSIRGISDNTGFSEREALHDLMEIIKEENDVCLIIKMHPLQPEEILKAELSAYPSLCHKLVKEADVPELLVCCDLVIGFYSNILLEAHALGKRVIRYFPGNPEADLLMHSKNIAAPISTTSEFQNQIRSFIHD